MRQESKQACINEATVHQKTRRTAGRAASAAGYAPPRGGGGGSSARPRARGAGGAGAAAASAQPLRVGALASGAATRSLRNRVGLRLVRRLPAGGQRGPHSPTNASRGGAWKAQRSAAAPPLLGGGRRPMGARRCRSGGAVVQSGERDKWKPRHVMNGATLSKQRTSNYPVSIILVSSIKLQCSHTQHDNPRLIVSHESTLRVSASYNSLANNKEWEGARAGWLGVGLRGASDGDIADT